MALTAVGLAAGLGLERLDGHVAAEVSAGVTGPELRFIDLPPVVERLGGHDLAAVVSDLLDEPWTDPRLCGAMAARLTAVGWIGRLNFVRRTGDGRFEVSAQYRVPVAMVRQGSEFLLTDAEGTRLPGTYFSDPSWKVIDGVLAGAPVAGERWAGDDLTAGLRLITALAQEPFAEQITGVTVANHGGRVAAGRCHIELTTDREGGRIRWGSAPGHEVEENSVPQKLGILRANYRTTGRADAGRPIIDISTFPDRFSAPG